MQLTKNFELREFVPKATYDQFGDKSIQFIDHRLPALCQAIRDLFPGKSVTINNWHIGGTQQLCGFRPPNCDVGAELSQHKHGRAADLHILGLTDYEEAREVIRKNFDMLHALGLSTIELGTPTWLHIDCRWIGLDKLYEVPFR